MGDDYDDVEDMLEAPFRKSGGLEGNGDYSPSASVEGKKKKSKHHRRSRHSRSRSHSPRRKRKRSGSRDRYQKSDSRERRRRSGSRDRRRRSGSRDKRRRSGSRDRRQRSGSRDRRRKSGSRERRRRSGSRERRRKSGSRERRRRSGSGDRRQRSGSRDRRRKSGSGDRRQRSGSRDRHQRSGSRDRRRRSGSRDRRQRSGSRDRHQRSGSKGRRRRSGSRDRSPLGLRESDGGEDHLGLYKRVGGRSPDPEPPSEERDRRTVMCMQLAAHVGPKELGDFFQKVGQVKEVKMIADKNSRRSKGIAYIEFHDENSVPAALQQTGQKLYGVPIIVQPTMAEKNRLAAQAQNLMKKEGPRKLYVGSLHYNISKEMLKKIFEPFGYVENLIIQRDENGLSKGYGFIEFRDSEAAERARQNLNGFELAGRFIKVNHVTEGVEHVGGAMELLDSENFSTGVGMTQQGRASLMAKLAEGHNAGLVVPTIPALAQPPPPTPSSCFMLTNMFDPATENEPNWEVDICDDVLGECTVFGNVVHIYVDTYSQGNVYVKCSAPKVALSAMNSLSGRFFAGKKVVAQLVPEGTYHMKFQEATTATVPLKPSS